MEAAWWTRPEQLDEEQKKVLALPKDGNHLVIGPPGSGKTNLLVLRAAFLHRAKLRNIAVLTFGRVLREFLVTGVGNYPFSADKLQTYVRWGTTLLRDNGVNFDENGSFEQVRARLLQELQRLAERNDPDNIFDCILIDEVQDYSTEEIDAIRPFAARLFAAGDNRQRIYNSSGSLSRLEEVCSTVTTLGTHYRNGLKICRVADGIRNQVDSEEGLEACSNYDESAFESSVVSFGNLSIQEQVALVIPEIRTQLRAYPIGMIGVLCPRHEELNEVWRLIRASDLSDSAQIQQYDDGYEEFDADRRVIVTTLHGAKGLEFRALHLLGMDWIKKFPLQKNITYTAVTRAKTSLRIYHNRDLPGYLEKGLTALENTPVGDPAIDELFL